MNKLYDDIFGFIAGFFIASIILTIHSACTKETNSELVKRGYKQYNSKTGSIEWIEQVEIKEDN